MSLGPWTSGPAHVYWPELGCPLREVSFSTFYARDHLSLLRKPPRGFQNRQQSLRSCNLLLSAGRILFRHIRHIQYFPCSWCSLVHSPDGISIKHLVQPLAATYSPTLEFLMAANAKSINQRSEFGYSSQSSRDLLPFHEATP